MKEIGKLIDLLNEYGNERYDHWGDYQTDMDFTDKETYWYLSKKFGFIKRLVENDKIETNNLNLKVFKSMFSNDGTVEISYEELALMLLAISDEPIEFLCEILK